MTTPILPARGRKSKAKKPDKPPKPRKDFPLFAHDSGQWAKKVRGKLHYFGIWPDPIAAEKEWERKKLALLEGRDPDAATPGDSVGWLCNAFMDSKQLQRDRGELSARSLNDYHDTCKAVAAHFGKGRKLDSLRPPDFERYRNTFPDSWGPTTINNHLRLVRVVFKYANDIEATPREIRYKLGLKGVPKAQVRKHEATKPSKEFTAAEVWKLYNAADVQMRAFILLGLNAAYGTMDIARLRIDQIDFANSWLGEPRGKTGVARGCSLWSETVAALRAAIKARPEVEDRELRELAFLTRRRRPIAIDGDESHALAQAFGKVKRSAKIEKQGVGHYALRHTFETQASNAQDQQAVDFVMGHHDQSMAGNYRHGIDQARVRAVCEHVRQWWLDGKPADENAEGGAE